MRDPGQAMGEAVRKEYKRLIESVEGKENMLSAPQRQHLGCWRLWVLLRLQLFTDDSFVFNKVTRNVRELVEQLPHVSGAEEEAACQLVKVRTGVVDMAVLLARQRAA